MNDAHIQEAAAAAQATMGFSTYFHGIGYDVETFRKELDGAVEFIKSKSG